MPLWDSHIYLSLVTLGSVTLLCQVKQDWHIGILFLKVAELWIQQWIQQSRNANL